MGEKRSTGDWGKAKLKKNTEFYMDMPTGKMGLRNPDAGADWELFQSTSTEKASYFWAAKNEWMAPREVTRRIEQREGDDAKETNLSVSRSEDS